MASLQRLSRRSVRDYGGAGRRLEMPRWERVVVISLERLGCDHRRLVMIWAIKSSSDLARRGGLAGGLGFAAALTGTAFASWGAAAGFSNRAGMARSAFCVTGGSAAVCGAAGSGACTGTPSGALGGVFAVGGGSAAATTTGGSTGGGSAGGGGGRSGMSAAVA